MGLPDPPKTSSRLSCRQVTCTVVSVIPYMFTSRGVSVPRRSTHSRREAGSSASPPKITLRSARSPPRSPSTRMNWRKAEGVWFSTVTPSRRTSAWNASGSRLTSTGTTTTRPP
jgi:hypothetical protein